MRRIIGWWFLLSVLVMVAVASAGATTVSNDLYGFKVTIPDPNRSVTDSIAQGKEFCESYVSGNLIYHLVIEKSMGYTDGPPASVLIDGLFEMMSSMKQSDGKSCRLFDVYTEQGIRARGSATIYVEKLQKVGDSTINSDVAKSMFGYPCYGVVMAVPLNERAGKVIALGVTGAVGDKANVENAAKSFAASFVLDNPDAARPIAVQPKTVTPIKPVNVTLNKGEIEIRGIITAIDRQKQTFDMNAKQVTEYKQKPVDLTPNRPKKVVCGSLPADVQMLRNVVVIGKSSGIGKPIKARSVVVVSGNPFPDTKGSANP